MDKKVFVVSYYCYCDIDTLHTEVFESEDEANLYEDTIWSKCQEAHIEVDVIMKSRPLTSFKEASRRLDERLQEANE